MGVFIYGVYGVLCGSYDCVASYELSCHNVASGSCMCHGDGVEYRGVAGEAVVGVGGTAVDGVGGKLVVFGVVGEVEGGLLVVVVVVDVLARPYLAQMGRRLCCLVAVGVDGSGVVVMIVGVLVVVVIVGEVGVVSGVVSGVAYVLLLLGFAK